MLGSAADAEDVVQDVWLKWQADDRRTVSNPGAFLATTTTRLAVNLLKSAHARRETYIGPWLPEPVDTSADPALGAERAAALELAVLQLLEKLSPTERAAYVLREAFGYPYPEIAKILQITEPNARQLFSRARKAIAAQRRTSVGPAQLRPLLEAFLTAARAGDVGELESLLAADAVSYSDGGGAVRGASRIPVSGRTTVARYVAAFASRFWTGVSIGWIEANGRPAVLLARDGSVFALVTVGAQADGIDRLLWVFNPAKLAAVASSFPPPVTDRPAALSELTASGEGTSVEGINT